MWILFVLFFEVKSFYLKPVIIKQQLTLRNISKGYQRHSSVSAKWEARLRCSGHAYHLLVAWIGKCLKWFLPCNVYGILQKFWCFFGHFYIIFTVILTPKDIKILYAIPNFKLFSFNTWFSFTLMRWENFSKNIKRRYYYI